MDDKLHITRDNWDDYINGDSSLKDSLIDQLTVRMRIRLRKALKELRVRRGDKIKLTFEEEIDL